MAVLGVGSRRAWPSANPRQDETTRGAGAPEPRIEKGVSRVLCTILSSPGRGDETAEPLEFYFLFWSSFDESARKEKEKIERG